MCVSCQLGSPITTRFTRTRLSDIVHPVSSSQLTQDPDRVRSFGGYNSVSRWVSRCFACDGANLSHFLVGGQMRWLFSSQAVSSLTRRSQQQVTRLLCGYVTTGT